MRVQIVHHNPDAVRIRVVIIHERLHLSDELLLTPSLGYLDVSPANQRLAHHEEVARAVAFVGVAIPSDRSRTPRSGSRTSSCSSLLNSSKTDNGTLLVVGLVVEIDLTSILVGAAKWSVKRWSDQRERPSDGSLQAKQMRWASSRPFSLWS